MDHPRVFYFVEGECEKKLISELKNCHLLRPGKIYILNVLTRRLSNSRLMEILPGSVVYFVFDTDGEQDISHIKENIGLLNQRTGGKIKIHLLIQVENLEDELVRSSNLKSIEALTNSKSRSDFKKDFLKLNSCMAALNRHSFSIKQMWKTEPKEPFNTLCMLL